MVTIAIKVIEDWRLNWDKGNRNYHNYCDQACKIRSSEHKKSPIYIVRSLLYHNLIIIYTSYHNKIFITTVEFNGLSYAAYRNRILHFEWKILAKIELSVICAQVVDFCRPGY